MRICDCEMEELRGEEGYSFLTGGKFLGYFVTVQISPLSTQMDAYHIQGSLLRCINILRHLFGTKPKFSYLWLTN